MPVIFIDPDGTITGISSEVTQRMSLGNRQRVSHVEPVNPILRWLFHAIRKRVADNSKVADFTRKWRCHWRARIFDGPTLGPFVTRKQAIDAEIAWINAELEGCHE